MTDDHCDDKWWWRWLICRRVKRTHAWLVRHHDVNTVNTRFMASVDGECQSTTTTPCIQFCSFQGLMTASSSCRLPYDLPPLTSLSHLFTFLFSVSPVKCMTYLSTRVWHTDNVFFTFVNVIAAVKYFYATTRRGLGGLRPGASPGAILVVSNVTDHPSTASILPTSYYSMWHCNCLWIINDWF